MGGATEPLPGNSGRFLNSTSLGAAQVSKLLASGLVLPAIRILGETGYTDIGEVMGKLAMLLAYATIASGHLPIVVLLLPAAALGETLLVAASCSNGHIKMTGSDDSAALSTLTAQALAAIVQLVIGKIPAPTSALLLTSLLSEDSPSQLRG